MSTDIRIKKGLDLKLVGEAQATIATVSRSQVYSIKPSDFHKVTPKLVLKEGAEVKAGEVIFYSKDDEAVKFVSPVSGKIVEIKRGEKRKLLEIKILADAEITYESFEKFTESSLKTLTKETAVALLCKGGVWPQLIQRPFGIVANPQDSPKAIFISGFDTNPLSPDYAFTLKGEEKAY